MLDSLSSTGGHRFRRLRYAIRHPLKFRQIQAQRLPRSGTTYYEYAQAKCIFVHIPKCAGNSIEHALFGKSLRGHHSIWYYQMLFRPREFREFFKFAVVRNPWDRLASAFFFLKAGGKNAYDKAWADDNLAAFADFESFVMNWVTSANINSWIHFRPQANFVCLDNRLLVDFVAHLENIETDFATICAHLNVNQTLQKINPTADKKDYRSYYNDETCEIVAATYAQDIALFDYDFDGVVADRGA